MVGEHELCGCEVATDDKREERKDGQGKVADKPVRPLAFSRLLLKTG